MDYEIDDSSQSDVLNLLLEPNENIYLQPDSIISKTYNLKEKISNKKTLWEKLATEKEKYTLTEVYTKDESGVLTISPPYPGSIKALDVNELRIESSSFLAVNSSANLELKTKEFFKSEDLNLIDIKNIDYIFCSGYHGVIEIELEENQRTIINEKYLLALDKSVEYNKLYSADSKHVLLGPGKIYLHTQKIR